VIPATKQIDAHAQDLVEKNQVLLPILKAFAQGTRSQQATQMLDVFSFCVPTEPTAGSHQ